MDQLVSVEQLLEAGLLCTGAGSKIYGGTIFLAEDYLGVRSSIIIGANVRIMPGAIIYGGTTLGDDVVVESHTIVGQPEYGYAVGEHHSGAGKATLLSDGAIVRAGAVIYAGVTLGVNSSIGHRTLVRTNVIIGDESQLGHGMTIERECRIGSYVRCTGLTHLTSSTVAEDRVFFGALVGTVNDKSMVWRQDGVTPELLPPYFEEGCTIGTGAKIGAGVRVGRRAMVGTGSVVTKHVAANTIVVGAPAKFVRHRED